MVKETLRARTMGNSVMRKTYEDLPLGDYVIPKGTMLLLSYELTYVFTFSSFLPLVSLWSGFRSFTRYMGVFVHAYMYI